MFNTWDIEFSDLGALQYLWFNSTLRRSKSKQFFFYSDEWFDKGVCNIIDLLDIDGPQPIVLNTFDQLIEKFSISCKSKRFYNFLIKNIPCEWLEYPNIQNDDVFDLFVNNLMDAPKVPKYAYSLMLDKCLPDNQISFWEAFEDFTVDSEDWEEIHLRNFKCSNFLTEIDDFLSDVYMSANKIVALGDFNLHIDVPTKSDVATFMSILSSLNMSQHVVDPTHKCGHTLDLIITRFDDDIVKNCNVHKCLSSDHYVVYFDVCKQKPPAQKIKSITRNYKTIDMPSFVNDLQLQLSQLEINDTTMTNNKFYRMS